MIQSIRDFSGVIAPGARPGRTGQIHGLTIHRFGVPGVTDARAIAQWYRAKGLGAMPYSFVVLPDGTVEQARSPYDPGPHAMRWSSSTIGIACIGDFTQHAPTNDQWDNTIDLCAMMLVALGFTATPDTLAGHTERPKATRYEDKECPGHLWPMGDFRAEVAATQAAIGVRMLAEVTA